MRTKVLKYSGSVRKPSVTMTTLAAGILVAGFRERRLLPDTAMISQQDQQSSRVLSERRRHARAGMLFQDHRGTANDNRSEA